LLGFAGPIGLVGSYFLTLGVFYAGALALNQMKTLETAKNDKVLDATVAITALGAIALVVCSILFANTSILAGVMSLPTLLGVVAPVALLLVAGSTITYTATSEKLETIDFSTMFDCKRAEEVADKEEITLEQGPLLGETGNVDDSAAQKKGENGSALTNGS